MRPGAPGTVMAPRSALTLTVVRPDGIALKLLNEGIGAVIAVADGTIVRDDVEGLRVTRGTDFAIEVLPVATDMAAQRTAIQADPTRKFVRFQARVATTPCASCGVA